MRRKKVHIVVDVNSGVRRPHASVVLSAQSRTPLVRVGVAGLALAVVLFFSGAFQTRAFTTVLYPSVCLGGWEQPHLAQGEPESLFNTPITELNGARLASDASAQIFCSRFTGTIPDGSSPREMRLKLYVRSLETTTSAPETTVSSAPEPIESSGEVVETPDELVGEVPEATEEEGVPHEELVPTHDSGTPSELPSEEVVPENTPTEPLVEIQQATEPEPVHSNPPPAEPEPVSWWRVLIPTAHASENDTVTGEEVVVEQPDLEQEVAIEEPVEQGTDIVPLSDFDSPVPEDQAATDSSVVLPEPEHEDDGEVLGASTDISHEPLLEVTASFDGVTRKVVGRLAAADFDSLEFDIPLSGEVTWDDFALLEIAVSRLPTLSDHPPVVLDGMSLTVLYDLPTEEVLWFVPSDESNDEAEMSDDAEITETVETDGTDVVSYATTTPIRGRILPEVTIDPRARHACSAEPFRVVVDASSGEGTFSVQLTPDGVGDYRFSVGSLPQGLEVVLESGAYERTLSEEDQQVVLSASLRGEVQSGDFTLPLLYTKLGTIDSTTLCQVNLSVSTEGDYE